MLSCSPLLSLSVHMLSRGAISIPAPCSRLNTWPGRTHLRYLHDFMALSHAGLPAPTCPPRTTGPAGPAQRRKHRSQMLASYSTSLALAPAAWCIQGYKHQLQLWCGMNPKASLLPCTPRSERLCKTWKFIPQVGTPQNCCGG